MFCAIRLEFVCVCFNGIYCCSTVVKGKILDYKKDTNYTVVSLHCSSIEGILQAHTVFVEW